MDGADGTDEITCPYCGYEDYNFQDSLEYLHYEDDKTSWACPKCRKEFTVYLAGWSMYFKSKKEICDD